MNTSGEAADQVVRMSLEVGEAALKISGTGAKHLAVMLYAVLKEKKKTKGRVRLETLVAFTFDFCGGSAMCGKSDGKTTEMSVLTETKDLKAVIEYVRNLSYTDSEKILLMGCSQGGFVSALVAAKNNFPIEKLVLFYPALCIPDDARAGKMMMVRFDPQNVPDTFRCGMMKLGRCYAMDVMQMDAFAEIKNYAGRVCIVHGTKDKIVDVSYAKRAAEAYKSTMPIGMQDSKRVQLHFIDGGGHMFSKKQSL